MKEYREELQELHHQRVYPILLAGVAFMSCCMVIDSLVAKDLLREFFFYRSAGIVTCLLFVLLNLRDQQQRYPLPIGFFGYLAITLVIVATIVRSGGVASPHYVALLLAMTIYAALAPITTGQTIISGLLPVALYTVTMEFISEDLSAESIELLANLFFLVSMVFIIATQSWADTRARKKEYQLRQEENQVTRELSREAEGLENEVEKRSQEQRQLEARFQLLFDQIADDVVLVAPDGTIIQANETFATHYTPPEQESWPQQPFLDIVVPEERGTVCQLFSEILGTGESVRNRLIQLKQPGLDLHIEAELSANLIQSDNTIIGILLIIRDITIRKQMEKQLFASLEMRKKTEIAAILALAKLSEFRDSPATNHLERIREYCRILARELSTYPELRQVMTANYIEDIYHASILHDIGKVATPDQPEPSGVDGTARRHSFHHTLVGGDIIREIQQESPGSNFLEMAKQIAYFHHERCDGKGVPYGLMKREIPLAARIMAVADIYEELTIVPDTDLTTTHQRAIDHITNRSGKNYDPLVVSAFRRRNDEFLQIRTQLP